MGSGPRISIQSSAAAFLLAREGPRLGSSSELTGLQTCIQNIITKRIKLVNVIQVMLIYQILPCQRRTCYLWEFDPAKHQTLLKLFGTTHEDIWKMLFKVGETPPPTTEDRGLSLKRQANSVSSFMFSRYSLYWHIFRKDSKTSRQKKGHIRDILG